MLAEYQRDENQNFLLSKIDSIFQNKANRENRRFVEHSVKYDYPDGSIDLFLKFYEDLMASDSHHLHKWIYKHYAKNNTPIRKKRLESLLLDSTNATGQKRKDNFTRITSLLKDVPENELTEFRIEFWEKSGELKCSSFRHINSHDPDVAFEIAKTELDRLEHLSLIHI